MPVRPPVRKINRRSRKVTSRDHRLDVCIRTSTERRRRQEKIGRWIWNILLVIVLGTGSFFGIRAALDKFFFQNADYTLRRITLPLLMPNLIVVLVLALIRAVQIFDEVFVLTGGGPGSATNFIVQFIYQTGFAEQIHLYGLAAAASLMLALGLIALTLAQLRLTRASTAGQKAR
jgi:hypothetical protein